MSHSVDAEAATSARMTPSALTWLVVVALVILPVLWLPVFLYRPDSSLPGYVIGRYSLLLAFVAVITLVVERLRHQAPWAAAGCAVVAWLGVIVGRLIDSGDVIYPWVIAGCAVVAFFCACMPGAHRRACLRLGVALAIATGLGLLGLA